MLHASWGIFWQMVATWQSTELGGWESIGVCVSIPFSRSSSRCCSCCFVWCRDVVTSNTRSKHVVIPLGLQQYQVSIIRRPRVQTHFWGIEVLGAMTWWCVPYNTTYIRRTAAGVPRARSASCLLPGNICRLCCCCSCPCVLARIKLWSASSIRPSPVLIRVPITPAALRNVLVLAHER